MSTLNLLFPHQLFPNHDFYGNGNPTYLVEEWLFFREFRFHKVKLAFHRASMKSHERHLKSLGVQVHYIETVNPLSDIRLLIKEFGDQGVTHLNIIDTTDNWLQKRIHDSANNCQITVTETENPLFINTRPELTYFKPEKKKFFQTSFYKEQRVLHKILVDDHNEPAGGQWTFDVENRKAYPKGKTIPTIQFPEADEHWKEALAYVKAYFPKNPGQLTAQPKYPYTHRQTEDWLNQFIKDRFYAFGDYEDAILKHSSILHHSVLTPMLNVGLITPMEVVQKSILYRQEASVPINSVEGFVRQLIGWREFIRGMYEVKSSFSRTQNYWGFTRRIPPSFYDGTTGIEPLDDTIKKVLSDGYCHHIERLMILGNFMVLCEFDPDEVYRWFMELFIDAYDWVMVPNVYGMSQFADGGLFATKPYISGSNYILKMSDYKKGKWQETWDGLFWRFMDKNRAFFLKNPRLSMLIHTFDKMPKDLQELHLVRGDRFLKGLDSGD